MCHVPLMGVKLGLIQTRRHLRKLFFVMIPLKVTGDDGGHVISYSNNSQILTKKKRKRKTTDLGPSFAITRRHIFKPRVFMSNAIRIKWYT